MNIVSGYIQSNRLAETKKLHPAQNYDKGSSRRSTRIWACDLAGST